MNEFTPINIVLTLCNIVLVFIGVLAALKTIKHFKQKNLYDQWLLSLTDNYQNHFQNVQLFLEKNNISIVEDIKNDPLLRKSVNFVLDWWITKSIGVRYNFISRKLAIRMAYHQIIFYYENLLPWIKFRRSKPNHKYIYQDFDWLYNYCKKKGVKYL